MQGPNAEQVNRIASAPVDVTYRPIARKRSVMAKVKRPSRARSADRLSSSRFISRASGQCFANATSIGAIECFSAWISAMRIFGRPLSLEGNRVHQAALAPGGVQAAVEF